MFGQIHRYEVALKKHKDEVLNSYDQVLNNLKDLKISSSLKKPSNLKIDFSPRLIVFEIDKDENDDIHLKKLRKHFSNRLILKHK